MTGISSKALAFGDPKNKKGYNGNELQSKEFNDGSGLEFYDFNARTYDQQIGRFLQTDPESEEGDQESWTPYHFGFNNPVLHNDPDGRFPPFKKLLQAGWDYTKGRMQGAASTLTAGLKTQYAAAKTAYSYATNSQFRQQANAAVTQAISNPKATLNKAVDGVKTKVNSAVTALKDPKTYTPQNVGKAVGTVEGTVALSMAPGAGATGQVANTTKSAMQLGREGMAAAGIEQNTVRIPSLTGTAQYRIPDGLTNTTLSEVKNVSQQSLTGQIKDFIQYSQQQGLNFELHVRPTTQLSKPLQQQVTQGNVTLKVLPITN